VSIAINSERHWTAPSDLHGHLTDGCIKRWPPSVCPLTRDMSRSLNFLPLSIRCSVIADGRKSCRSSRLHSFF